MIFGAGRRPNHCSCWRGYDRACGHDDAEDDDDDAREEGGLVQAAHRCTCIPVNAAGWKLEGKAGRAFTAVIRLALLLYITAYT